MEIVHYKSIKEIPQNEWEKYGLDFALSDGVYDGPMSRFSTS